MTAASADATLVTAYLAGDRSALGALYDRFAPSLYDTAAAMLSDRDEAADVVQDTFLVAAERMGQLRDPERIKAWLFAIARHEIYRRTKRRRRVTPSEHVPDMAAPTDMGAEAELVAYQELATLVREAAAGLDERDQLVLELSVRQGLQGADLAAALGVTPEQSYTMVHRMRERVERTMGALVVARQGRKECRELQAVLTGWDGTFSVLWRKRVARHVDSCETCERTRRKIAPLALFGSASAFALPTSLRARVLDAAGSPRAGAPRRTHYTFDSTGFPAIAGRAARRAALLIGAAAGLAVIVTAVTLFVTSGGDDATTVEAIDEVTTVLDLGAITTTSLGDPVTIQPTVPVSVGTGPTTTLGDTTTVATTVAPIDTTVAPTTTTAAESTTVTTADPPPPTTTAPAPTTTSGPPGHLDLSATVIDLGPSANAMTLALKNTGGHSLQWTRGSASPFGITGPMSGTLDPGQTVPLTISIDRSNLKEGSYSATLTIGGDVSAHVTLKARVERPPSVDIVSVDDANATECTTSVVSISVAVGDESSIAGVSGTWQGPAGSGSFNLSHVNLVWNGQIVMPGGFGKGNGGVYTFTITAKDSRSNVGTDNGKFFVQAC